MSSGKKIGLFACTGIVAGNMMGSGIALLPSNLASIGSVALFGWIIAMFGALALAYVYPENRGIYTQSDSSKKSSRNIWSLAVVSVDQRY